MEKKTNNYILIILGSIALLADLITIGQSVLSGSFFDFWSFNWLMTINFVFLLLAIGIYLFYIGSEDDIFDAVLISFATIYITLSLVLYLYFGYAQLNLLNTTSDFFAYVLVLFLLCLIGISFIFTQDNKTVLFASYGYGIAGLVYVLMLGYKYVFLQQPFTFLTFFGEIIIALIGALLFYIPYAVAEGKKKRPDYVLKYYRD